MRIVLDTNVAVSALLWRGTPYALLQHILRHQHDQLFSSSGLLQELGKVLSRPKTAQRLLIIGRASHEVLADYADAVELVTPLATPRVVASDPDDDMVVATAVAAGAELLVSGDRDLLMLGRHESIRIVSPSEAFQYLRLT